MKFFEAEDLEEGGHSGDNRRNSHEITKAYGHVVKRSAAAALEIEESLTAAKNESRDEDDRKKETEPEPTVPFYRLFEFAGKYEFCFMFFGSLGAFVHGCGLPVFLLFFGKVLNGLGVGGQGGISKTAVNKYTLYFVWLALATFVSSWLEVSLWMLSGDRQSAKLRTKYLEALLRQDVAFFDTEINTGAIVSTISSQPFTVQEAISEKMGNFIHLLSTFAAGFAIAFTTEWRIALVTVAIVPVIAGAGGGFVYTMRKGSVQAAHAYDEAGSSAEQALAQVRTVYSFVSETKFIMSYSASLEKTMKLGARVGLIKGIGMGFTTAVIYPSFALLLWYGGVLIRQGAINGGQALTTIFSVVIASIALGQAVPHLEYIAKGKAAAHKIFQIIDHEPKIGVVNNNAKTLKVVEGHIELRKVDFVYPARPDVIIFRNFSLRIPAGKTVAIVGSSGSGKSTVVSLIERFYDPIAGKVLLDGHDIRKLNLKWLRQRIGLVNQEPALFATTIAANILYGKDNATQEEIEAAGRAANAHSFIEGLPLGYQTQVGERGVQLSGGQKQRVAIARAMLRNPTVLLLDEATSALDAGSEQVVQEALDRLMVGRTTVVVAHRLSTIQNADTIAVVQQGQIVEKGTHSQLISREDGAYSALVRLQEMAATKDEMARRSSVSGPQSDRLSYESSGYSSVMRSGSTPMRSPFPGDASFSPYQGERNFNQGQIESGGIPKGSLRRLMAMCKPEWKYGLGGVIGSMLAGCQNPAFALLVGQVVTAYSEPSDIMKAEVSKYTIILVAVGLSSIFILVLQHYSLAVVGENLVRRVREKMFTAILRNELGWFDRDENNSSQILARFGSDATNVRVAIGDRMAVLLQNLSLISVAWIVSIVRQWKLALVVISITPLLVFASATQKLSLKSFNRDASKAYVRATQVAAEAVTNIRTVAAFNAEGKVRTLFMQELKGPSSNNFQAGQIAGFGLGLAQCLLFCSYALGLWYSGKLISDEGVPFGNVIKVFLTLIMAASALADTFALTPDLAKGDQAVKSVFQVLDRKTAIDPEDPLGLEVRKVSGHIELKHVTFAYPARPDVLIFGDLNLKVRAGRSLALVGASGSGKSSVIALIERFYDPISGQVLIDGKDLKKYNLRSVRQHIALVSQEPALFSCTIYENILYGKEGASKAEVIEAAKAANAHKFISSLPEGYDTPAGERGMQLSGGQKQRIAIARAVLKDPAILLLDEATSALDAESEKIVQEALDRLMKRRTTVMVAHRLSTIRGANTIAVVQDGGILEEGSHEELTAKGSVYARLVNIHNRQTESG